MSVADEIARRVLEKRRMVDGKVLLRTFVELAVSTFSQPRVRDVLGPASVIDVPSVHGDFVIATVTSQRGDDQFGLRLVEGNQPDKVYVRLGPIVRRQSQMERRLIRALMLDLAIRAGAVESGDYLAMSEVRSWRSGWIMPRIPNLVSTDEVLWAPLDKRETLVALFSDIERSYGSRLSLRDVPGA